MCVGTEVNKSCNRMFIHVMLRFLLKILPILYNISMLHLKAALRKPIKSVFTCKLLKCAAASISCHHRTIGANTKRRHYTGHTTHSTTDDVLQINLHVFPGWLCVSDNATQGFPPGKLRRRLIVTLVLGIVSAA